MIEIARVLGWSSATLLLVALAVWVKLPRGAVQRLAGRSAPDSGRTEVASQLLVLAGAVSAIAALLAVAGWIVT